jgi:hypothetical protein
VAVAFIKSGQDGIDLDGTHLLSETLFEHLDERVPETPSDVGCAGEEEDRVHPQ